MDHPEPFDRGLDEFLAGDAEREPDVDHIFAKDFARVLEEFRRDAPDDIAWDRSDPRWPSLIRDGVFYREVQCGVMMVTADDTPIGGYLSCDLSVEGAWQGHGLGAELIIERCLRDGSVPTWALDEAAYSPAGIAAHRAAWSHARRNPDETRRRLGRMSLVEDDGVTVWVNGPDGSCLGRFGTYGIDIHRGAEDQIAGNGECLLCTHGPTDVGHWRRFVDGMMEHHGATVPERHMPQRFRDVQKA